MISSVEVFLRHIKVGVQRSVGKDKLFSCPTRIPVSALRVGQVSMRPLSITKESLGIPE